MAAKDLIQVPALVDGFKPMKDRSWKITFETRELTGEEVKTLADNFQGEGWLVYSPNEVGMSDIPEGPADAGVKSPSTRLRDRLFIYWKRTGERGDFESFYRTKIEQFIEVISNKIPEEE